MRNLSYIAKPKAYEQTENYYNRVSNDAGVLISAHDTNKVYDALNRLYLQNRAYKLYYAEAGLQKTDDNIDKLYDLGKNDVDQTFSGSDRPKHIQAWDNNEGVGNWQMSVEKEATNYCKESNDLGGIFGGNWTKTEGTGDSPFGDSGEAVEVEMNTNGTGASNYIGLSVDTATSFSSGVYITVSFYAKKIAGSSGQPELLIEGEDSNSNPISLIKETFSTQVGEYQFFEFTAQFSADGTLRQAGCRIQDNDTSADTVYQFWGMQIERGQYATSRIYTVGGIATRLLSSPVFPNFHKNNQTYLFWVDAVNPYTPSDYSDSHFIVNFSNGVDRIVYRWNASSPNGRIRVFIDGNSIFSKEVNWSWPAYTRRRLCFVLSYSDTYQVVYVMDEQGNAFKGSENFSLNNFNADMEFILYSSFAHSNRFEVIKKIDEAGITDDRFKKLASATSKYEGGANLETEDITIQ